MVTFDMSYSIDKSKSSSSSWDEKGREPTVLEVIPYPSWDPNEFLEASKVRFNRHWNTDLRAKTIDLNELEIQGVIGEGCYSNVYLVKQKTSNEYLAMKVAEKKVVVERSQVNNCYSELKLLTLMNFTYLISLEYFTHDYFNIYFVMPFIGGGELWRELKRVGKLDEERSRFYAAQVVLALEYLHHLDLVHRDIKPENMLLDCEGFLKVADLGFCRRLAGGRAYSMCGTPEYMAPEVFRSLGHGKAVDWWALGVLLFELNAGFTPFHDEDKMEVHSKAGACLYPPVLHFTEDLRDIIGHLLTADLSRRYGNLKNGVEDIKNHGWFHSVDWVALFNRNVAVDYKPLCDFKTLYDDFPLNKETSVLVESQSAIYQNVFEHF